MFGYLENVAARVWWLVALVLLFCVACGCAHTHLLPDGSVVTVGQDVIPGVIPADSEIPDLIGAAEDAINPTQILTAATEHDWLGLAAVVVGAIGSLLGGFKARQLWRARKKAA